MNYINRMDKYGYLKMTEAHKIFLELNPKIRMKKLRRNMNHCFKRSLKWLSSQKKFKNI